MRKYFKYIFKSLQKENQETKGILVKEGQSFNFVMSLEFDEKVKCYCTRDDTRKQLGGDDFKIHKSTLSKNGTDVEDGIIPSIFYTYA
jgi:hypothetical protein